jgi:hypothetical protein
LDAQERSCEPETVNPILEAALKDAMALLPADLPDEIATVLGVALTHMVEAIIQKHLADPAFGPKMTVWSAQAQAAKGGSDDDKANASASLYALMQF